MSIVHTAKPSGIGGLPVLDEENEEILPGDTITETVWGRTYQVIENPSGDKLEMLAASAGVSPEKACFTIRGDGRDFAYHKAARARKGTTYFKTEGHP